MHPLWIAQASRPRNCLVQWSMASRWRSLVVAGTLAFASALGIAACPASSPAGDPFDPPPACGDDSFRETLSLLSLAHDRNVDILFVIDNSGTMGEEQARLVESAGLLFERLDELDANYRIAFTTTDNGNPWCPAGQTTPEGGKFVLSPCTERLGNFLYNNGTIDAQDLACNDLCSLDAAALDIAPTTTYQDSEAKPRPWLERTEGLTNFPPTTEAAAAFACYAPQGINGCGFESQLESMYMALLRAQDSNEDQYGFLRPGAIVAVVVLSDEADCSYDEDHAQIFDPNSDRAFWSDPDAAFPSSAVCWNAGVACEGDPSAYDSCEPMNYDPLGTSGVSDDEAVMLPLSRYGDLLAWLEADGQQYNAEREVIVSLIAGGEGHGEDFTVAYAEAADPDYQLDFGIGPGCTDGQGDHAVPPVRMRALAEEFGTSLHSVCDANYDEALVDLGNQIAEQIRPLCFTKCVGDSDLSTPWLETDCSIELDAPGEDPTPVVPCLSDEVGRFQIDPETQDFALPDGADVCFATRVDPDGTMTADPNDDMSAECADLNFNLEFVLVRREGRPTPIGAAYSATCSLSDCPELECPGIGG